MPLPTLSDVHTDPVLTNILIAFQQSADKMIADKVFPAVPVAERSGIYYTWDKDDWNRIESTPRAPGSESSGGGNGLTTATYSTDVYAVHFDVHEQIAANASGALNIERDATAWVANQLMLRKEKLVLDLVFGTSAWTGSTTGADITPGTKWDNASGDPVNDVLTQRESVLQKTGQVPNTMVVGPAAHRAILGNADVLDRLKYTVTAVPGAVENALAAMFQVEKYLVANATNVTSAEGATEVDAFIGTTDSAWIGHVANSASILMPSAGYNFVWSGLLGAGSNGTRVKRFEMPHFSATRIEGEVACVPTRTAVTLGALFVSVDT